MRAGISLVHYFLKAKEPVKKDQDLRLLNAGKLSPGEVLRAALALKSFVRNHRRQTHQKICRLLKISRRRFYRFLAISRWSKKVRELVSENARCLSQTALFRLADRKWLDARQLFNFLKRMISYLSHRKRRRIKRTRSTDHIARYLQSPLKKVFRYILRDRRTGEIVKVRSDDPEKVKPLIGPDGRYSQVARYMTSCAV